MGITVSSKGNWKKTTDFLSEKRGQKFLKALHKYGKEGVKALSLATPVDTGLTAASWDYEIRANKDNYELVFTNSNIVDDWAPVAILIQYGHATKNGGFVRGIDYINPALTPVFERLAYEAWIEVTK